MRVVCPHLAASFAALAALAPPAPSAVAPAPAEEVVSGFDLLGWRRLGVLSVRLPELQAGGQDSLLDGDPLTHVRVQGAEASFALDFAPAQVVRRVVIVPAGDAPQRVTLTVVEPDGDRFAAGEQEASPQQPAIFRLMDVAAAALEVEVARVDGQPGAALADVLVEGRLELHSLSLEGVPDTLPEGASFPFRVTGRDGFGGRPDLTALAQVLVSPAQALVLSGARASTRVQGPVALEPRLGELAGPVRPLLVTPLDPAPPAPQALPGTRVVELRLQGEPPFEVFRRAAGEKAAVSLGRTLRGTFYDDSVQPGTAYGYSARRVDLLDNALTATGPEARARTHGRLPPGVREVARVPLLLAVFTDSLPPGERERVPDAVQAARLFAWRHTLGRVLLDPVVLEVPGPTPVTSGPTMVAIEARLRELGVEDGRFSVVAAVSHDFEGDWSGFRLLGDATGLLLRGHPVPTPPGALGPAPALTFSLMHELHHAGTGLVLEATGALLPTGHPEQDFTAGLLGVLGGQPFDVGDDWDLAAALLAGFDGWSRLPAPWARPFELLDTDGDGLADVDDRLPLDERRLGTDPLRADSDDDGAGDFAELAAGLYRGSNPIAPDSDGDGLRDGFDAFPLSDFTGVIAAGRVPRPLASLPGPLQPYAPPVQVSACWTRGALTLEFLVGEPSDVFVDLDGSGRNGRWESDVNTGPPDAPAGDAWTGPLRLALRAFTPPLGVYAGGRPVRGALVAAETVGDDQYRVVAVLPPNLGPGLTDGYVPLDAPLADGLRLQPGTVLGLGFTLRPSREPEPAPFDPFAPDTDWFSTFELHRLLDAVLQE